MTKNDREREDRRNNEAHRWTEAENSTGVEALEVESSGLFNFVYDECRNQKARKREEDFHANTATSDSRDFEMRREDENEEQSSDSV
jgi:hypothetical protein